MENQRNAGRSIGQAMIQQYPHLLSLRQTPSTRGLHDSRYADRPVSPTDYLLSLERPVHNPRAESPTNPSRLFRGTMIEPAPSIGNEVATATVANYNDGNITNSLPAVPGLSPVSAPRFTHFTFDNHNPHPSAPSITTTSSTESVEADTWSHQRPRMERLLTICEDAARLFLRREYLSTPAASGGGDQHHNTRTHRGYHPHTPSSSQVPPPPNHPLQTATSLIADTLWTRARRSPPQQQLQTVHRMADLYDWTDAVVGAAQAGAGLRRWRVCAAFAAARDM
ncbi:hypothetical protein FGG08_007483, partial [Glutinoglossum americanum]